MEVSGAYIDLVCRAAHQVDLGAVQKALDLFVGAFQAGRQVFVIGNGGSAANASHFAQDLCKTATDGRPGTRFRVLSLTDNTPFLTAIGNDLGYDQVFEYQLRQWAEKGDLLVAISGSGNSPNILRAVQWAREHGVTVVSFTGFGGGKLLGMTDVKVHVPLDNMCATEAVHSVIMHLIVEALRDRVR